MCGFENPEDVAYAPAAGIVVVSEMRRDGQGGHIAGLVPGGHAPWRLWPTGGAGDLARAADAGDPSCSAPDVGSFAPHGVFVDRAGRLWVVNHGGRESVEVFALRGTGADVALAWLGCVVLPPKAAGNDLAVAPDGELVVSNFMPHLGSLWGNVQLGLGLMTGDVIVWRRDAGWRHIPETRASGANGVEVSPDGEWIYYAETGGGRVVRVARSGGARVEATVPGMPDNLSWSDRGKLYVASHQSGLAFLRCAGGGACRAPWALYEIDPATMQVSEVLRGDGQVVGAIASAAEVAPRVYLGAVFGDRIGVWTRP